MTIPVQYPSAARPARITRKFTAPGGLSLPHEGVDIYAPRNTNVRAGAAGEVMRVVLSNDQLNYGPYVNILTKVGAEKIRVFYANLKDITVKAGDVVTLGQVIAKSAGDSIKLVIQSPPANPYPGFPLKYIAHPKNHLMVPRLRLKPIDNRLRLRRT